MKELEELYNKYEGVYIKSKVDPNNKDLQDQLYDMEMEIVKFLDQNEITVPVTITFDYPIKEIEDAKALFDNTLCNHIQCSMEWEFPDFNNIEVKYE